MYGFFIFRNFKSSNLNDNKSTVLEHRNTQRKRATVSNFGFSWNDGSDVDFSLWGHIIPAPPKEKRDCVYMFNSTSPEGGWQDAMCDSPYSKRKFVCEVKPTVYTETTTEGNY